MIYLAIALWILGMPLMFGATPQHLRDRGPMWALRFYAAIWPLIVLLGIVTGPLWIVLNRIEARRKVNRRLATIIAK